ncbi:DUF4357 domain-containing protein [Helcococcus kunzii]|uniref:DUF4357 domain-containing protein n=1 Tax=Helcococcus kunzii TaxID=40091 RepID=UPI0024AE23C2|nr:DUF4357 domain-containing protein [Helcococcus kunzii]
MSRGIIYVMTTVVPGLVKIGKTGSDNFESRMYNLERNGYSNVAGLKRKFAIEVEDYDKKEMLIDEIFSKSRVPNTELFALDIDLVIQLLSSFEGTQVYPERKTKEEVFDDAVKELEIKSDTGSIPDGKYYLERTIRGFGKTSGKAIVEDGIFKVLKGSICAPAKAGFVPDIRKNAWIENNILMEDIICSSPSTAGWIIIGRHNNGWVEWKDESGKKIDIFRNQVK